MNNLSVNVNSHKPIKQNKYVKKGGIILASGLLGATLGSLEYNLYTYPKAVKQHKASRNAINNVIKESLETKPDFSRNLRDRALACMKANHIDAKMAKVKHPILGLLVGLILSSAVLFINNFKSKKEKA